MTNQKDVSTPLPSEISPAMHRQVEIALLVIFFIVPSLCALGALVSDLQTDVASLNWPTTNGSVLTSNIIEEEGAYAAKVTYSFNVNGSNFESDRIHFKDVFIGRSLGGYNEAQSLITRYPVGAIVTVYYNPANPKMAVLEPGPYGPNLIGLLVVSAFFLIPGLLLIRKVMQGGTILQTG